MKHLRTVLAVVAGLLMAGGYTFLHEKGFKMPRAVVGVLFGTTITWNLLKRPDFTSEEFHLVLSTCLLAGLVGVIALRSSPTETIAIAVWTLLFGGVYYACARLHRKEMASREEEQ